MAFVAIENLKISRQSLALDMEVAARAAAKNTQENEDRMNAAPVLGPIADNSNMAYMAHDG